MKFVHIADMHFDSPFKNLADKPDLGDMMRMEQRKALKKIIEYIKNEDIPFLFISGDLYEQKYIRKTTIEYINNLFKEIPNTKIFISPGNHDPFIKNSYYNQFIWSENVTIFTNKAQKVETEEADIYGCGFDDFYCEKSRINDFKIENKNKINILVIHGSVNASETLEKNYNPMTKKAIEEKGFDYIALGHIHKRDDNTNIVYPGSTVTQGFDELGAHGMIVGEIEKDRLNIHFKKVAQIEFEEIQLDCTEIISKEELIEKINNLDLEENKLYKIVLNGKRNFEIDIYNLFKFNLDEKIIKIKNCTKPNYDLNSLSNETTLRGLFTKEMINKLDKAENEEQKSIIEKAIELGLEVLE